MSDILLILLPGAMYFWILFIGQAPLQEVVQEQDNRILSRVLACPVTPGEYVLSKLLRCFTLCTLAAILLLAVSALMFGMRWGNPLKLLVVIVAWSGSMTGLLGVIYAVAQTREQANVLSPMVLMVFAMLGGSMFPYENLPAFLRMLGQYTPNRWAVLLLQGVVRSRPLPELISPLVGLLALGLVGTLLAFFLFNRRLSHGGRK
ncbi:MAG TPA: ABC transporter permease [Candidatus Limnocylindrales bacterium]|jgi:ABC-2 type transport system permease protein|nr:ABC transporter permease [Candidatus Limnocylindrales bacterium]